MSARSFVVARGGGDDREYFAGVDDFDHIMTAAFIFGAFEFGTEAEAAECAEFLAENDLTGFEPSEITSGTSPNIAGEQA